MALLSHKKKIHEPFQFCKFLEILNMAFLSVLLHFLVCFSPSSDAGQGKFPSEESSSPAPRERVLGREQERIQIHARARVKKKVY